MFYKQTPVNITGYGLAAGCQVFYRKIYGVFLQCTWGNIVGIIERKGRTIPVKRDEQEITIKSHKEHFQTRKGRSSVERDIRSGKHRGTRILIKLEAEES